MTAGFDSDAFRGLHGAKAVRVVSGPMGFTRHYAPSIGATMKDLEFELRHNPGISDKGRELIFNFINEEKEHGDGKIDLGEHFI